MTALTAAAVDGRASTGLRITMAIAAVANLGLTAGYATQQSWAIATWPVDTGRLSYLFVASILAAITAGAAWIAISGEAGSLPAGALTLSVMTVGATATLIVFTLQPDRDLLADAIAAGVLAVASVGLLLWSRHRFRSEVPDPVTPLVRWSYVAFTLILLAVGGAMVLQVPRVVPWTVDPVTSALIGWIFLGNATYFAYGVARPHWPHARAQLWSFLAYDVVLIGPLAAQLRTVPDDMQVQLYIYLAALVYSSVLAVVVLLIDRRTRVVAAPVARTERPG